MEDINNYNGNIDNDIIMENSLSEMYDEVYLKYESKKILIFSIFLMISKICIKQIMKLVK
jgi:hypothetical protein